MSTGKPANSNDLDKEAEVVIWSDDDPETRNFKQLMAEESDGKDVDGSIDGVNTLADVMQDNVAETEAGNYSRFENRSPPAMAIVGLEDDLSTIANDTVNGSMVEHSREAPLNPTPKQRDFNEYTPKKKRSPARDSDEDTAPETPPGLIRVPDGKNTIGSAEVKTFNPKPSDEYMELEGRRTKRIFLMALVLGTVLIVSIGALAIALIRLRQEDSTTTTQREITLAPEQQETPPPDEEGSVGTQSPIATSAPASFAPSTAPVQQSASPIATQPSVLATRDDLLQVLAQLTPESLELLEDINSPQYQAFSWLSSDPNYFDYDDSRLIQRWVLAIFFLTFEAGDLSSFSTRQLDTSAPGSSVLIDWMTYSDECFWNSSQSDGFCNDEGLVRNIDIRDGGLSGTLPKELALLSNSLGK
jgi:hypothetical protein